MNQRKTCVFLYRNRCPFSLQFYTENSNLHRKKANSIHLRTFASAMGYHPLVNCSLVPIVRLIHDHDVLVPTVYDIGYPLQLLSQAVPIINTHSNLDLYAFPQ